MDLPPPPPALIVPAEASQAAIENLRAIGPVPELADELNQFGQFVGVWDLDVRFFNPAGERVLRTPAVWMFSWILDGRGIQDVIVFPNSQDPGAERRLGSTIRYYDANSRHWKAAFVGAHSGIFVNLEGGLDGEKLVLKGVDGDGSLLKWTFNDIGPDRFHWIGYNSRDGGKTWWTEQDMIARRRRVSTEIEAHTAVLWRRLDTTGTESARLTKVAGGWELSGTAVFQYKSSPCTLTYTVGCNEAWRSEWASVDGWCEGRPVHHRVRLQAGGRWTLDGQPVAEADGCVDLDLNFSPSTNTVAIRRLNLPPGGAARVDAAWLRFPSFRLERLSQEYRRTGEHAYHYESDQGAFSADLTVDDKGLILAYPPIWSRTTR